MDRNEEEMYRIDLFCKGTDDNLDSIEDLAKATKFQISKTIKVDWDKPIEKLFNKIFGDD